VKYPRTFHFPFSLGATNDDRIAPDFDNLVGVPIVITEKLDGENTCLNARGVFARSHSAPTRNPWASYLWQYWDMLNQQLQDLELFGESLFAVHSLTYTQLESYFYLFAIRQGEDWLSWEDVKFYAGLIDFPTVPVLFEGVVPTAQALQNLIEDLVKQPSKLCDEHIGFTEREGVVVRLQASFSNDAFPTSVLKWVRANHVQTDEHWTRRWKRATLHHEWR
jgi:hypothetical protein